MTPEPHLTRRPDPHRADSWLIMCGDIVAGNISRAVGLPGAAQRWAWFCGFYPGSNPGEQTHGTADSFDAARADFEATWRIFVSKRTEADYQAWHPQRDFSPGNTRPMIEASGCRRTGGLVNCDRQRDSCMATRINLVGQRFGYLTVTSQVEPQLYQWRKRRAPLRVPQYEVKCDCGTVKITKAKLLRNGSVKSCGCRRYSVRTYAARDDRTDDMCSDKKTHEKRDRT